jgi:hypothetical protein
MVDRRSTEEGAVEGSDGGSVKGGGAEVGAGVAVGFVEDVGEVVEGAVEDFGVAEVVGVGEGADGLFGGEVVAVDVDAEDVSGVGHAGDGEVGGGEGEGVGETVHDAVVGVGVAVVVGAVGAGVVEPCALEEEDFVAADVEGEDGVVIALGGELEDAWVGDGDFFDGVIDFVEEGFLVVAFFGAVEVEEGPEEDEDAGCAADRSGEDDVIGGEHGGEAAADEGEDEGGEEAEEEEDGEVGGGLEVGVAVDSGKFFVGGWTGLKGVHDEGTPSVQQRFKEEVPTDEVGVETKRLEGVWPSCRDLLDILLHARRGEW